jgi:uncharacterized protein
MSNMISNDRMRVATDRPTTSSANTPQNAKMARQVQGGIRDVTSGGVGSFTPESVGESPAETSDATIVEMTNPVGSPTMVSPTSTRSRDSDWGITILAGILIAALLARPLFASVLDRGSVRTWSTVFVAIFLQALPFLALGVVLSGAIAAFMNERILRRILPKNPVLAVPFAGVCGIALPGCECGSVPIAGRLMGSGVHPAAALTFLLAAPAVNPVVLVATAVAFPNSPRMWIARFVASLITSIVMGWLWIAFGRTELVERAINRVSRDGTRGERFRSAAVHDLLHAGGYLVVGAAAAATLQVFIPRRLLDTLAGHGVVAVITMAMLAVLLSICSEADAFVASGLNQFGLIPRLVFLVVGPGVDLKLIAMQSGVFGRAFARRFASATLVVATLVALAVGAVLL